MKIKCVIYVKDCVYGKRLLGSISSRSSRSFAMELITDLSELESLLESFDDEYMPDALITDEESFYQELRALYSGRIIVLTEEQMSSKQIDAAYGDEVVGVYRYQTVQDLYGQIMDCVGVKKRQKLATAEIVGIYSPVNVMPRQVFALNVAKVLGERYKVLYINLDAYTGLGEILPERENGNLSDVLYYYRQGKEASVDKIKGVINTCGGIDYIAPARCMEDLECLCADDFTGMLTKVAKDVGYEIVVLDMYPVKSDVYKLLDVCTNIYMPVHDDYLSKQRVAEWECMYCEIDRGDVVDKVNKVKLPEGEQGLGKDFWDKIECGGMYRYVKSLFRQGV